MKAIYSPTYPVLMAAPGPKCGKWGKGRGDRVPTRCVRAPHGPEIRHLQDVDPRYLRPDWMVEDVSETCVLFRDADGAAMALRGFAEEPTDASLATFAGWLGASSWITLGTISGKPGSTVVTEVDYAADGTKVRTFTRPIGQGATVELPA